MVNLLIAATGSVASIKLVQLVKLIHQSEPQISVKVVLTKSALQFVDLAELKELAQNVYQDEDELWSKMSDPILHIDLRTWADGVLISPLSANTLAKLANGLCDNLLTTTLRAWQFGKPIWIAPAMNSSMWDHPCTRIQLDLLASWGYMVIDPVTKNLACGEYGNGAMAEPHTMAELVVSYFKRNQM